MKIDKIIFDNLDCISIETKAFHLIVTTQVGPRIAWFGKNGDENLLYWAKDAISRTAGGGTWKLYGGHRVWLSRPNADESEDTYLPDNELCSVNINDNGVDVCAPASPINGIAKGMEIRVINDSKVMVRNYLRNDGTLIYSGGCWSPTCVVANKPIEIPLGCADENPTWDIVYMAIPRIFAGNTTHLEDEQIHFEDNTLILTPKGKCSKRCVRAEKGIVQLRCDGYVFRKTSPMIPFANYPMNGCNIAAFIGDNNFMAEMETFGCEQTIKPGQTIDNIEYWEII